MKYEKLIRIEATKVVWPENINEKFEAYETKKADEAFDEIIAWYKDSKNKAEKIEHLYTTETTELNNKINSLEKENTDIKKQLEIISNDKNNLEWKNNEIIEQLTTVKYELNSAKEQLLTSNNTFNVITNKYNTTVEKNEQLKTELNVEKQTNNELTKELENKNKEIEQLKLEIEKLRTNITSVENTFKQINELTNYYNQWKQGIK